jgi:hypothetical protein
MDKLRKDARRSELRVERTFKGKLVPASGSGPMAKGDVRTEDELIEVKYTTQKSYSLRVADLDKHVRISTLASLRPVYDIEFDKGGHSSFYVVMPELEYLCMKAQISALEAELDRAEENGAR